MSACGSTEYRECGTCAKRVGWFAVYANLALTVFKAFIGYISGSRAILVDSLFSFKDFVTSLIVVAGIRMSGKPADDSHPYGYGKIEFVAMLLMSIFLIIASGFLFIHSIKGVWTSYQGHDAAPKFIAFWAALISVVANYKISTYLQCVGERLKSPAILANAKHSHSDAISSILVAGGVLGAKFGLLFLDPLVAIVETIDLMMLSLVMFKDSLNGLFDAQVHNDVVARIESTARLVPGVRRVSKVSARQTGQTVWVDITIRVDHHASHEEGYIIGLHVKESLRRALKNVSGVHLTIEPYMV
ncbi:MAG TPA: magnetosome biogenesis CDF transporter MamM [Desulfuromonadales bacterium]|nr:magnetosome biogenesis CDF transporter MamM [Desulfuromonadales bacterium]